MERYSIPWSRLWPAVVLVLLLLTGAGLYAAGAAPVVDVADQAQVLALITQKTGRTGVQLEAAEACGNLYAVSYSAGETQGLVLLERVDGPLYSGYRYLDNTEHIGALDVYYTELEGVVSLTVLYGDNSQEGAVAFSLENNGGTQERTLPQDTVLELFVSVGAENVPHIQRLIY